MNEKVDTTFVDRTTKIDNILMEEMLPVLKKLQTGDITVQMAGTESEETLQRLLDIAVKRYNDDNEIVFFSYPNDGTRASTAAGDLVLDYRHGTIKAPVTGTITRMSSSLSHERKEFLRSIAINCDQDVIIQLDGNDKIPVLAGVWHIMNYQQFQEITITTTETKTNIFCFASTNPKNAYTAMGESVRFSGTLVDSKSGVAGSAESAAIAFDRVVNRVRVIANDYDMYIRTSADGTTYEDQIHVKADIEQVFDVACHSLKVQRYGINDAEYEIEGYR